MQEKGKLTEKQRSKKRHHNCFVGEYFSRYLISGAHYILHKKKLNFMFLVQNKWHIDSLCTRRTKDEKKDVDDFFFEICSFCSAVVQWKQTLTIDKTLCKRLKTTAHLTIICRLELLLSDKNNINTQKMKTITLTQAPVFAYSLSRSLTCFTLKEAMMWFSLWCRCLVSDKIECTSRTMPVNVQIWLLSPFVWLDVVEKIQRAQYASIQFYIIHFFSLFLID